MRIIRSPARMELVWYFLKWANRATDLYEHFQCTNTHKLFYFISFSASEWHLHCSNWHQRMFSRLREKKATDCPAHVKFPIWTSPHWVSFTTEIFTARVRSTREGNVYTWECLSIHRMGRGYLSSSWWGDHPDGTYHPAKRGGGYYAMGEGTYPPANREVPTCQPMGVRGDLLSRQGSGYLPSTWWGTRQPHPR